MAKLAGNAKIALAAITHVMALDVFYNGNLGHSALAIRGSETVLNGRAQGIEQSVAVAELAAAVKTVTKGMPKDEAKLWDWMIEQDHKALLAILAVCVGSCADTIQRKGQRASRHAPQLAKALGLDMANYWKPTAEGYFARVSKDLILEAVTEGSGKPAADKLAALKKDAMAKQAEEKLAAKNWLPAILR
jgi:ParB family chromosome partitioning protein